MKRKSGFTLVELLTSIAILAILISILVPVLFAVRETVQRRRCGSRLQKLGQSLLTYAASFSQDGEWYPAVEKSATGKYDTVRSLWLLVKHEIAQPEAFLCPSDSNSEPIDPPYDEDNPFPDQDGKFTLSYSYQIPQNRVGHPGPGGGEAKNTEFAILADRSPFDYQNKGALLTAASGSTAEERIRWIRNQPDDDKVKYNSPNHLGDGQNVVFKDGHCEWMDNPLVGIDFDNIYTRQGTSGSDLDKRTFGLTPSDTAGPTTAKDSYLRTVKN